MLKQFQMFNKIKLLLFFRTQVGIGRNTVNATKNATRHAEMNCVDCVEQIITSTKTDRNSFYRKIEVYVNVEPCIMCASALLQLKVNSIILIHFSNS